MHDATQHVQFDPAPRDPFHPTATPIYQTATFAQESAERFGEYDYSRTDNPTRAVLETQLARLEDGTRALAFSSGMAAIATLLRLVRPSESIVAGSDLYGGTNRILVEVAQPLGIKVRFVDLADPDRCAKAIDNSTRLVLVETPTNPLQRIVDLARLCRRAKQFERCFVAVDNTMLSPHLQQPLQYGADVIIQSATKWLCGHGDVTAGALITRSEETAAQLAFYRNVEGNALSPFDAFLLLRGMKTLGLRVDRQETNARTVAEFLVEHPAVRRVHYAGLPSHPGYEIQRRQARGAGAVVSFETGSREISREIVESLERFTICVSFGSVHSTASLPCAMSHASIPEELRKSRKLPEDLVRLSIGIEDVNDLLDDLDRALSYCARPRAAVNV